MKIIKYGAEWCNPCKLTTKVLKDSGYEFQEIDVDENEELADQKKISSIPVIEFYNDNNVLSYTHVGLLTKDLLDKIVSAL